MTTIVIDAPDQLSEYAVATLLRPYAAIRIRPAEELELADVLVLVAPTPPAAVHRLRALQFEGPCVPVVDRVGATAPPIPVLRRSDVTPEVLFSRIRRAGRLRSVRESEPRKPVTALDERETAILRMLAEGLEVPEIAARLNYSEGNVKRILSLLMTRLGLSNRWQAVAYAFRADLI